MKCKTVFYALCLLLLLAATGSKTSAAELPDDSIYHIDSEWIDSYNNTINIVSLSGKVHITAFVYTYCEHSCPIILGLLKQIENDIPKQYKDSIGFLLISLDPERDTPDALRKYMVEKKLDSHHWRMLHGKPDDVLELSVLTAVRYKPMNNDNKDIEHSNMITVLDKAGRIHYQMRGLDGDLDKVIEEALNAAKRN